MISYFFLGWLFLLAKNNPDFRDPFIRSHAKSATKMHIGFLWGFWIYSQYLASYIRFPIPLIPTLTFDKIVSVCFFVILAGLIIRWAYLAHGGITSTEVGSSRLKEAFSKENIALENTTETEKMIYISSYIPFLGIITASRHANPITRTGAKIGSLWIFVTILLTILLKSNSDILWIILFAYLFFVAFVWASLFVSNTIIGFSILESIPSLKTVYGSLRVVPTYLFKLVRIIFGKEESLSFTSLRDEILKKDQTHSELALAHFIDSSLPLPKNLIFIPIINLIFIPQLFLRKQWIYTLAILQGIVITIVLVAIWLFLDFTSLWQMILLFPIFIGMAEINRNPFYKIPAIYELYVILDFLTFGLGSRVNKLKERNKESGEKVSFKV